MDIDVNSEAVPVDPVRFAKALADPTRQRIMELVCCGWLSVGDIVEAVGVGQPTVSHHLSVLKAAGLVHVRSEGKHSYYSLNQARVAYCCGQLIGTFAPASQAARVIEEMDKEG